MKVYRLIDATPEEVMAVFCDFSTAKSFVPKLLKSDISNKVSPTIVEVDYGVDVPILPDEFYTVRNTIKASGKGCYQVDWKLLRAVQTKDSIGSMRVEPMGEKCLMGYPESGDPRLQHGRIASRQGHRTDARDGGCHR